MLAISTRIRVDAVGNTRKHVEKHKLTMPVLVDAKYEIGALFGSIGVPRNVVIGRDGKVAYTRPEYPTKQLFGAIEAALAAK